MKATFIGIGKAYFHMGMLVLTLWVLRGFETPTHTDIIGVLAVGAILRHFIDREEDKQSK